MSHMKLHSVATLLVVATACSQDTSQQLRPADAGPPDDGIVAPPEASLYDFANKCVAIAATTPEADEPVWLSASEETYAFTGVSSEVGSKFFMKASDLGTYLLYDEDRGYVVAEDGPLIRKTQLQSDVYLVDDTFISGAEWLLEASETTSRRYQLRHRRTGKLLGSAGLVEDASDAAALLLQGTEG